MDYSNCGINSEPFRFHARFVKDLLPLVGQPYNTFGPYPGTPRLMKDSLAKIGWDTKPIGGDRRRFSYYDSTGVEVGQVHYLKLSRHNTSVSKACSRKNITRQLLSNAGLPVPRGFVLDRGDIKLGRYLLSTLGQSVIVKPSHGAASKGLTVGVRTHEEFNGAWDAALEASKPGSPIVVEEQIYGFDLRAFVVGGKFVAGATRLQPYVVGDGVTSVEELVKIDISRRQCHAQLAANPPVIDNYTLELQGYSEDSAPAPGEVVFLNPKPTLNDGAVTVEVTPLVSNALKELAIAAVRAIEGLEVAAVDFIVPSLDSADGAVVLELNEGPGLYMHVMPAIGKPVNVTDAVCSYLAEGQKASGLRVEN